MSKLALDALDAWREIGEFTVSPIGRRFLAGYNRSARERGENIEAGGGIAAYPDDDLFPEAVMTALARSPIYAARPDTVDLVTAACETVPFHPVLAGDEMPTDCGFVLLANPISMPDVHGRTIRIHALQWWPSNLLLRSPDGDTQISSAAVYFAVYSRGHDLADDYSVTTPEAARSAVRWPLAAHGLYPADQHAFASVVTGAGMDLATMERANLLIQPDQWQDSFICRWLLSWWMVVKEQMIEVTEEAAPRSARRRLERATGGELTTLPSVKVVDLRRRATAPSDGPASQVDWSHRWPVRPHWRRQWYPSLQQHKLKLINSYIKGPEDKPLIARPIVFDVRPPRPETP